MQMVKSSYSHKGYRTKGILSPSHNVCAKNNCLLLPTYRQPMIIQ